MSSDMDVRLSFSEGRLAVCIDSLSPTVLTWHGTQQLFMGSRGGAHWNGDDALPAPQMRTRETTALAHLSPYHLHTIFYSCHPPLSTYCTIYTLLYRTILYYISAASNVLLIHFLVTVHLSYMTDHPRVSCIFSPNPTSLLVDLDFFYSYMGINVLALQIK